VFGGVETRVTTETNILTLPGLAAQPPDSAAAPALPTLADARRDLSRLASGLGLSAVYGLALGAHAGGLSLLKHALGAPLGLLVVAMVSAPALFVRLALMDAPLRAPHLLAAVAQGTFATGLVLAGLAPAAAMLVVSIQSPFAASALGGLGLLLAGGIGLVNVFVCLDRYLQQGSRIQRGRAWLSIAIFALLSCALAARTWHSWLPLFGGAP
jgi:hypothetical protein